MSASPSVSDLLKKISKAGAELFLYRGSLMLKPDGRVSSELRSEIMDRAREVKAYLVSKMSESRAAGSTHKWVLRLGDTSANRSGAVRPAYLACGSEAWCMRMIRQSQELSDPANRYERERWIILEQDEVGALVKDDRGVLIATALVLPSGAALGGPRGAQAEVLSVCDSCLTPAVKVEDSSGDKDD